MNPLDSQGTIIQDALISSDCGVVAKAEHFNHWIAAFASNAISVVANNGQTITTGPIIDPARIMAPPAFSAPGRIIAEVIDPACIVVPGYHDRWQRGVIYDRPDMLAEHRDSLVAAIKSSVEEICRTWQSQADDWAAHSAPHVGVIHTAIGSGKTSSLCSFWPKTIAGRDLSEKLRPYVIDIDPHAMRPMLGPITLPASSELWHKPDETLVAHPQTPESVAEIAALARSLACRYAASFLARYLVDHRKNKKTLARVVWRWLKKMVPVRGINLRNRISARKRKQREDYREQYIIIRPLTGIRVRITQQEEISLLGMLNVGNLPVNRGENDDNVFVRLGRSRRDLGRVAHARRAVASGRRSVADGHRARPGRRGGLRGAAAPVRSVGRADRRAGAA